MVYLHLEVYPICAWISVSYYLMNLAECHSVKFSCSIQSLQTFSCCMYAGGLAVAAKLDKSRLIHAILSCEPLLGLDEFHADPEIDDKQGAFPKKHADMRICGSVEVHVRCKPMNATCVSNWQAQTSEEKQTSTAP